MKAHQSVALVMGLLCTTYGCTSQLQEAGSIGTQEARLTKPESPNSPDEEGTRQYNMEAVRKGMPPIPILMTRKAVDQLIKDGELSPRNEWK